MAFREVTMLELKEVLRRWVAGEAKKSIARGVGVSRNTVRAYVKAGVRCGLVVGLREVTDAHLAAVLGELSGARAEPQRGESWAACERQRDFIKARLAGVGSVSHACVAAWSIGRTWAGPRRRVRGLDS